MKKFKKDIEEILVKHYNGEVSTEEAVRDACLAYEKEVADTTTESVEDRRKAFKERMKPYAHLYDVGMLERFYNYFTSFKTPKSRMMHFEKQKTFSMGMRLKTWKENQDRFARERHKNAVMDRRK